jgi:hypothetical protein
VPDEGVLVTIFLFPSFGGHQDEKTSNGDMEDVARVGVGSTLQGEEVGRRNLQLRQHFLAVQHSPQTLIARVFQKGNKP